MDPAPTDTLMHEQPAHIILFRRVADDDAGLLAAGLGVSPLAHRRGRPARS